MAGVVLFLSIGSAALVAGLTLHGIKSGTGGSGSRCEIVEVVERGYALWGVLR
jgi:hypothetical protein